MIKAFVLKLWKWYKGHEGVSDAHHTKYTDAEVDAIVAVHRAISDAHHSKYTDAEAVNAIEDSGGFDVEGVNPVMVAVHATNQPTKSAKLGIVQAGANSYPGIWLAQATPDVTNYAFLGTLTEIMFNSPAGGYIAYRIGNANKMKLWASGGFVVGDSFYTTDPGTDCVSIEKNLSIRATTATRPLDINSSIMRLRSAHTPATAGSAGYQGDLCWDADYVYVCVATNTWKRSAIGSW